MKNLFFLILTLVGGVAPARGQQSGPAVGSTGAEPVASRHEEWRIALPDASVLRGNLLLPAGKGPFPAAVMLPDVNEAVPMASLVNVLGRQLVQQGVVVLQLLPRTGPELPTLAERAADVAAALSQLRSHASIDPTRVGLVGHGQGGNVALLAGAQSPAPAFVVAVAAAGLPVWEMLASQPLMYGLRLSQESQAFRYQQWQAGQHIEQTAYQMQLRGLVTAAQVQTYKTQQYQKLKAEAAAQRVAEAKRQRALVDVVRQLDDNAQAQAILGNMLRQYYPSIAPADAQATVQQLTSRDYRDYVRFDPQQAAKPQCPVLLVHGTADASLNADANLERLQKTLRGNKNVDELRCKNLDHALRPVADLAALTPGSTVLAPVSSEAQAAIGTWINQRR